MNREKSFVKSTIIITIGKLCTQLVTFFLLPLYTGILSTEEYGIVDLLHTLVSLLLPIITLQIELAIFRELIEVRKDELEKEKIISTGVISVILNCLVYLIIFIIIMPFIHNEYKLFLVVNVLTAIFSSLFLQIARGLGDNKKYAVGSFLSASSTVLFNVVFLVGFKLRVNGMLLGTLLGQIVCLIYLFISLKLYKYIDLKKFDKIRLKKLWKYSIPLIPNQISWWIFNASDRVIVSKLINLDATGILSASNKFPSVITTLYNIFYLSFSENIMIHVNDDDIQEYYNKLFNVILTLFISISIIMLAGMKFVFPIMIDDKFNGAYNLIPFLILANIFNVIVSMVGVVYSVNKNTKAIASTSIAAAIVNLIVHLILIKTVGLYAAVISTFVSYFVMALYRLQTVKKHYFKVCFDRKMIILSIIVMSVAILVYYLNVIALNIISLTMAIIFAIISNKNSMKLITKMIKKKKI